MESIIHWIQRILPFVIVIAIHYFFVKKARGILRYTVPIVLPFVLLALVLLDYMNWITALIDLILVEIFLGIETSQAKQNGRNSS
ncbi:hypothetical protein N9R04_01740 [Staphylococcus sp. SQ8-PEA]|uniref:Uncharacterized protein n=1 Tax=Staphylococcus marylandisciuri TaxID=2981529 RepID=A0ABT2QN90_9STAP|nr:hypothetical protein [Staphylococcus marylandisciuri]MCU5745443.1 hypothetical protein [Staphylococcus marylandisciuri]